MFIPECAEVKKTAEMLKSVDITALFLRSCGVGRKLRDYCDKCAESLETQCSSRRYSGSLTHIAEDD